MVFDGPVAILICIGRCIYKKYYPSTPIITFISNNFKKIILVFVFSFIGDIVFSISFSIVTSWGLIDLSFLSGSPLIRYYSSLGFLLLYLGLGFVFYKMFIRSRRFKVTSKIRSVPAVTPESQTVQTEIERLLKQLESPSYKLNENRAIKMGKTGDIRFVEPLIKYLSHSDKDVRIAAIKGLGFLGDRRAVEPIVEVLTHDWSDIARGEAAAALGKLQDPRAVAPLIEVFSKTDPLNWECYDSYIRALRKMDKLAVPGLINMLDDPHPGPTGRYCKIAGRNQGSCGY